MFESHDTSMQNKRILVTGGAGFIGSHTAEAFLSAGARVLALDNFDPFYSREEKECNLAVCRKHEHFTFAEGDIRDASWLEAVVRDFAPDLIVHLAARAGVRASLEDPAGFVDVNVRGTMTLLEAARRAGASRVIFASSSSVYGSRVTGPFHESDPTDEPVSPYGASKKAGELLCGTYHRLYGMSVACLRLFTVYGPRQRPDLAIRKFVTLGLAGQDIPIYGDGSASRDYTHIRDILSGILGAARWVMGAGPRCGIFNLGSSSPVTLLELVRVIEQELQIPLRCTFLPLQLGDVPRTCADVSLAERELEFRRTVPLEEGIREFVQWMRTQPR